MFDEDYEAHDQFGYSRALAWIHSAEWIVFIGTSHAVRVAQQALELAPAGTLLLDVNLRHNEDLESWSVLKVTQSAEEALLRLMSLSQAQSPTARDMDNTPERTTKHQTVP
eukprot:TRINITY_DN7443_c0_g1_i2.p1 TRINITY_DN7443_c0_g1~~TRINITY_DN7443_c0_g1_i2.p1  ORF type:complete len:111 (-),score=17.55 TRINITY_DN7443_c0_g1_i2:16-348(-)